MSHPSLRITDVRIALIELPLAKPLRTAIHEISRAATLMVSVDTDAGLTGEGYGFCFDLEKLKAIAQMCASLRGHLVGRDPHDVEAIWAGMLKSLNFYGQAGVAVLAMNPLDIACWDLIGQAAERPLYQLFGACRDRVPVYASAGLWLSADIDELRAEAAGFVRQGFKAMKMRLGSARWQDDVERVAAVREVIGADFTLMADANQSLSAVAALRLARALEPFDLAWFEEPMPTWCHKETAALARALDTPIANGETEYTRYGVRAMVEAGAADIMMPDLQRMGGYTEMRKAMAYLATLDIPVAPHIFTEHSLHLVASAPNAIYAEHMPWFEPMFQERMVLGADGLVDLPKGPGTGFRFDWNAVDAWRVAP
ncbi:mandelate racemase/muconate lactonizing enzyme family protein [Xylophilus sp. GOD-11R]|uniref:mandelate racemase/muconate lactonizing enzyme family protein n=1 Tax=Xylophilus sp. GOD-11R TaxID=3089814 RepID=UPI00298C3138|nr:mandelate racemase/muconate lactonizing enzyme family protein [Xylophilus sp. GOD-11R]WPB58380.1 mandelate racemase/muconate lactonizing enzyme family protein [Xylophilus sp. GOD-11R]